MELKKNLKQIRISAGLSQEYLANEMLVSRQTISKWETGDTYPSVEHIFMLAKILGCSFGSIVGDDCDFKTNIKSVIQNQEDDRTSPNTIIRKKILYWSISMVFSFLVILICCSTVTIKHLETNIVSNLDMARLEVFDKIADGFIDSALGNNTDNPANKKIVGYGISNENRLFYIKCNFYNNPSDYVSEEPEIASSAIIYFHKDQDDYTYSCQYLDDLDYRPDGEYHEIS